jgi:hypothetical protein
MTEPHAAMLNAVTAQMRVPKPMLSDDARFYKPDAAIIAALQTLVVFLSLFSKQ